MAQKIDKIFEKNQMVAIYDVHEQKPFFLQNWSIFSPKIRPGGDLNPGSKTIWVENMNNSGPLLSSYFGLIDERMNLFVKE